MRRLSLEYAELHARSAFSLLDGASTPEQLAARAAEIGLQTLAMTDLDDLGGAVRFAEACRDEGVHPIFGAELSLQSGGSLVLLCENASGWSNLARLITIARREPRGWPAVSLDTLSEHHAGLVCLSGGREGALEHDASLAEPLSDLFGDAFYVEVSDHELAEDVARIEGLLGLADRLGTPWLVTADARHAAPHDKCIHDALICLKHKHTIDTAGDRLFPNDARHLRAPIAVHRLWSSAPSGVLRTLEVAERCRFRLLEDLHPRLPTFPLPEGVDDGDAYLRTLALEGFRRRYASPSDAHHRQLDHELRVIRELGLAGYFLIVHDIVRFARHHDILAQGRGSAANSVVCYCLGITAVDPIGLDLLFERFLSEGRGEPPDIDIDIAHRDRERVLQYVYERYGREHAAMTCETITWRGKSSVRDAARVLGFPTEIADRLARQVGHRVPSDAGSDSVFARGAGAADRLADGGLERAGLDARDARVRALLRLVRGLEGIPRHRGIHVGGFVLTGQALCEVVPIEPAAMKDRTVIQWDKDDLGPLGLVKIDLLGLGMLTLLSKCMEHVREHHGPIALHTIPADDAETYAMIQAADTVGVFQVESRAQMNVLPRTRPERFFDLVVQVALIRPGPIQGEMVHPYMRRRRGEEPITYLHPLLESVLHRTLGVPLFQEQGMKVAITAAGFSPAQADALRRAMGRKRNQSQMARIALELLQGMQRNGISRDIAERIVKQLAAFASYGFPESHAASFALLVYASAYLKRHHPAEFYAALLAAQPMGFYPIGTILSDARRHGVRILGPDVNASFWETSLEPWDEGLALRLGFRRVHGLGDKAQDAIERAIAARPFRDVDSFVRRAGLPSRKLVALARAGAFDSLASDRRRALWEVLRLTRPRAGPLDVAAPDPHPVPIEAPSDAQRALDDYATLAGSPDLHPIAFLADRRRAAKMPTIAELKTRPTGRVRIVGLVIARQRPETAKGFVFLAIEDETGIANVVVRPDVFDRQADVIAESPVLYVEGELERKHDVVNVIGRVFKPVRRVPGAEDVKSHDFH